MNERTRRDIHRKAIPRRVAALPSSPPAYLFSHDFTRASNANASRWFRASKRDPRVDISFSFVSFAAPNSDDNNLTVASSSVFVGLSVGTPRRSTNDDENVDARRGAGVGVDARVDKRTRTREECVFGRNGALFDGFETRERIVRRSRAGGASNARRCSPG